MWSEGTHLLTPDVCPELGCHIDILGHSRILGIHPPTPPLELTPNPAPTQTLDLTQGRGGTSPETRIDPTFFGLAGMGWNET